MCWHDHRLVNLRDMPFEVKLYRCCKGSVAEMNELSQCQVLIGGCDEMSGDGTQRTESSDWYRCANSRGPIGSDHLLVKTMFLGVKVEKQLALHGEQG